MQDFKTQTFLLHSQSIKFLAHRPKAVYLLLHDISKMQQLMFWSVRSTDTMIKDLKSLNKMKVYNYFCSFPQTFVRQCKKNSKHCFSYKQNVLGIDIEMIRELMKKQSLFWCLQRNVITKIYFTGNVWITQNFTDLIQSNREF